MKPKDKQVLKTKSIKDLNADLLTATTKLNKLKLDLATNKLKDTSQLKKTRHQIAVTKYNLNNL